MKKELNDAIRYEEKGIKMYDEFALRFNEPVFSEISAIKKRGSEFLKQSSQNSRDLEISFENLNYIKDKNDAVFKALAYEIEAQGLYDKLAQNEENESLKDIYFRIWATSVNEYKPALQNLLNLKNDQKNSYESDQKNDKHLNPNGTANAFNYAKELNEAFDKFKEGKITADDALNLIQNPTVSFVGGALVGALGGVLLNQLLNKSGEDE